MASTSGITPVILPQGYYDFTTPALPQELPQGYYDSYYPRGSASTRRLILILPQACKIWYNLGKDRACGVKPLLFGKGSHHAGFFVDMKTFYLKAIRTALLLAIEARGPSTPFAPRGGKTPCQPWKCP